MKALVVYYSRTGITRQVACDLAERLDADTEELADSKRRGGLWGWLSGVRDALGRKLRPIGALAHAPEDYDLVLVGTPVWANTMSTAVRAFLADHGARLRAAGWFCTLAGKDPAHTFDDMTALSGQTPHGTLAVRAKDVKAGRHVAAVDAFAHSLVGDA